MGGDEAGAASVSAILKGAVWTTHGLREGQRKTKVHHHLALLSAFAV